MQKIDSTIQFLGFTLATVICFYTHLELEISPVIVSASIGLLGSLAPKSKFYNVSLVQSSIYSGSFAGMCSFAKIESHFELWFIGFIGGVVFLFFRNVFDGHGGKLGSIAFIASISLVLLKEIL